jgi:hypothetical protein
MPGAYSLEFNMRYLNVSFLTAIWFVVAGQAAVAQFGGVSGDLSGDPFNPSESEENTDVVPDHLQDEFGRTIHKTATMTVRSDVRMHTAKYGLDVVDVSWEDTGRFFNSAVGDNISDLTIQIQHSHPKNKDKITLHLMPVIRYPNFDDKTCDVPLEKFELLVGNQEEGGKLKHANLKDILSDLRKYMSDPKSWPKTEREENKSLLAKRDTHVLVSAQACFLPIPAKGEVEFNPVLFNYQSGKENPAVLTLLATRQGTSVTIIDNNRDPFEAGQTWGQRLFFNAAGSRAPLTAERKADYEQRREAAGESTDEPSLKVGEQVGLNMVLVIQVPLKHKAPELVGFGGMGGGFGGGGFFGGTASADPFGGEAETSDVEEAVVSHGPVEGPFTEMDGIKIQRDPRFPIRVTVQFYQATSNGVVNESDVARIAANIQHVYADADFSGSLVTAADKERPTLHAGPKVEPPWWWESFWLRHERDFGPREATLARVFDTYGHDWMPHSRRDLVDAVRSLDLPKQPADPNQLGQPGGGGFF